jgi:hypothetical protein
MAVDPLADLFGTGAPVAPAQQDDPLADLFGPTPVAASTARAAPEKTGQPQQFYDGSFFGELGEGIASGVIGIGEGLAGLGAAAVDVVADTTYGDSVTAGAEAIRDALGLDPEGFVGKGAEIVTQFVVPGIGAAAKVGSLAKAARTARGLGSTPMTKAERFALAGKELAAAGVVDAAVSTDGMITIGDWVDMGPTQTSDLIGLHGREKALARINNKLKIGVESTLLGGVAQGALMTAGKTIGDSRIGQLTAKAASARLNEVGKNIDTLLERRMFAQPNTAEELGFFKTKLADAIAFSRYRGFLPEQIATKRELIDGQVQTEIKRADRILKDFETSIDTFLKRSPEGAGNLDRAGIMSKLESYLTEPDAAVKARLLGELPVAARVNAVKMREHIDGLSKSVLGSNFLKQNLTLPDGTDIKSLIEENINTYLRRRYKIFEDSKYVPTAESTKVADDFFRANRKATEKELTQMARGDVSGKLTDDFLAANGLTRVGSGDGMEIKVGAKVTDAAAQKARENFLGRYSIKSREKLKGGYVARDRLETGMFMARENVPKALRQLLGEVDDPREAYLGTVADLAQFSAVDDYFGTIANLSKQNSGIGKLFVDGKNLSQAQQQSLRNDGFVQLGGENGASSGVQAIGREVDDLDRLVGRSGWGSLDGFFVPRPVYKNLTNVVLAEDSIGIELLRGLFGSFLKAKGISQYSKTVLSPITQIRNFTTAAAFATANGNVPVFGRGGSLKDSAQAVFANITNRGSDAVFEELADAQRRGVLGTNAELREIQDTLNKGLGMTAREPKSFVEAVAGTAGGAREKIARGVGKLTKPLENAYQGSDDFWKFFSYNAEQTQIRNALDGATPRQKFDYLTKGGNDVSEEIADIVRRGDIDEAIRRGDIDIDSLIKDRAAQLVRDTVPNYNKAGSGLVQLGRRLPVGNFISFPAEMYRTGFNIVRQALDDMASDIPGVRARGQQRMMGFITTTAVVPAAALELAYATTGVGREEMDAYKRSFAAPWEKGAVLMPLGRTEDGKIQYVNFSTSNPYDVLSRFANRAMNEADDAMREGKDLGQVIRDVGLGTLTEVFEPFLSEAILTEALLDVSLRGGRTATGAEVYNSADSFGAKNAKMFGHVVDTLMPNLIPANITSRGIEPSRFLRGVLGSEDGVIDSMDNMGRVRNPLSEFARQITGVSPLEFDPKLGLEYNGYRLSQLQTDAKRMFNRVADDPNASPQSLFRGFEQANNAKLRIDREYYQLIQDLRTMGMTNTDIRRVFKQNGIGGINGIMRGEFEPFEVSKKNVQEMRRAGILDQYPREDIAALRSRMRRLPLSPEMEPRTSVRVPTSAPAAANDPLADLFNQGPAVTPAPVALPAPAPAAQQAQQAPAGNIPPLGLLGSDPVSQARNAEIAQRRTN